MLQHRVKPFSLLSFHCQHQLGVIPYLLRTSTFVHIKNLSYVLCYLVRLPSLFSTWNKWKLKKRKWKFSFSYDFPHFLFHSVESQFPEVPFVYEAASNVVEVLLSLWQWLGPSKPYLRSYNGWREELLAYRMSDSLSLSWRYHSGRNQICFEIGFRRALILVLLVYLILSFDIKRNLILITLFNMYSIWDEVSFIMFCSFLTRF